MKIEPVHALNATNKPSSDDNILNFFELDIERIKNIVDSIDIYLRPPHD
jgi:hypothetical protein